jgi:hypothetical protein
MSTRHPLRAAALAALATLAASGARAIEATQWNPQAQVPAEAAVATDGMLEANAWTVGRGEATQFHDGVVRDTMSSRAEVRHDLAQARHRGWLPDTGEAGATDPVWDHRAAFVASERDRELAPLRASSDPIGVIAALETEPPVDHDSKYALASGDTPLRMPVNQTPDTPASVPPLAGEVRREDIVLAEGPRALDDSLTVDVR